MLNQKQRPSPEFLLRRTADATKIPRAHPKIIAPTTLCVRYIYGKLVVGIVSIGDLVKSIIAD
jgi:hypothetical protein